MDFADIDQGRVLTSLSDQLDVGVEEERDSFLFWMLMGDLTIFTEVTSTIPCSCNRGPPAGKRKPRMGFLILGTCYCWSQLCNRTESQDHSIGIPFFVCVW